MIDTFLHIRDASRPLVIMAAVSHLSPVLAAEARSTSDPAELDKVLAKINTRMVDEAVFVWFVHDVWPNAISSKVKGYVHPKSWYVDFSPVTVS